MDAEVMAGIVRVQQLIRKSLAMFSGSRTTETATLLRCWLGWLNKTYQISDDVCFAVRAVLQRI